MTTLRRLIRVTLNVEPVQRSSVRSLLRTIQARNDGDEQDACRYLYACGLMDAVASQGAKP